MSFLKTKKTAKRQESAGAALREYMEVLRQVERDRREKEVGDTENPQSVDEAVAQVARALMSAVIVADGKVSDGEFDVLMETGELVLWGEHVSRREVLSAPTEEGARLRGLLAKLGQLGIDRAILDAKSLVVSEKLAKLRGEPSGLSVTAEDYLQAAMGLARAVAELDGMDVKESEVLASLEQELRGALSGG